MHDLLRLHSEYCRELAGSSEDDREALNRLLNFYLIGLRTANHLLSIASLEAPEAPPFTSVDEARDWLDSESLNLSACSEISTSSSDSQAIVDKLKSEKGLADLIHLQNMWADPVEHARRDTFLAIGIGDEPLQAVAYNNLGVELWNARRFGEAIDAYQEAVNIYRDMGDRSAEAKALSNLGAGLIGASVLGERQFDEAIAVLGQAAQIFADIGDVQSEAMTTSNLGLALQQAGRLEDAIVPLRTALQLFQQTGDQERESIVADMLSEIPRAQDLSRGLIEIAVEQDYRKVIT
jgi:tetratricopeptide (TPR) repeat protein